MGCHGTDMNRFGLRPSHDRADPPSAGALAARNRPRKNLQIEETFFNLQETFVTIAP